MFILSLFTNPLVAKESWINLSSKTEELQKIKIATNFIVGLSSEIGLKPPKNFLWKLKNLFGTYELDYNNISYQILPESLGGFDEIELWSSCKVIPIYKGNKPYELIINELKEILKKE